MDLGLKDKAALVMASSAGIGKAIALEFAREGAGVMLFGRSEDRLKQAQKDIAAATGVEPVYTVGDMTHRDDILNAVANTRAHFGSIYALVNNTGGPPAGAKILRLRANFSSSSSNPGINPSQALAAGRGSGAPMRARATERVICPPSFDPFRASRIS